VVARTVGVMSIAGHGVLRGQHEPILAPDEEFSEDLLTRAGAIIDRGVDDVAARLGIGVDDPAALLERCPDAALFAEGHRPQEQLGHSQSRVPEPAVLHHVREPPPNIAAGIRTTSS
jgi:hypothetical protein